MNKISEKKSIRLVFEGIRPRSIQGEQKLTIDKGTRKPYAYNTEEIQDYIDDIWNLACKQIGRGKRPVLQGAIEIRELMFEFYTPNKLLHNRPFVAKPDWVNVTKLLEDILQIKDLVLEDDKTITDVNNLKMRWSDRDCITIELGEL